VFCLKGMTGFRSRLLCSKSLDSRECIDYKTSMITDEDPLRGLLFY